MSVLNPAEVRSGTFGSLWLDGELACETKGLTVKIAKNKNEVPRSGTMVTGHKVMGVTITGTVTLYNATSRLIRAEGDAIKRGRDLRHTLVSKLDDPDNPNPQRIQLTGVSFDDLTLAQWEAAQMGEITAPFTADDYDILEA